MTVPRLAIFVNPIDELFSLCHLGPMKTPRIGRPPVYIDRIRALKPKKQVYFAGADMDSIKAIASRVGKKLKRQFTNRSEDGGVIVWRES